MLRLKITMNQPAAGMLVLAAGLLLMLAGCAPKPAPMEPLGLTFLPAPGDLLAANGTRLSGESMARIAARSDYILMGEFHASPCDHSVQTRMAWTLALNGVPFVLGLEMVPANATEPLSRFNQGELSVDELEEALDWEETWGYPFEFFRDTFEAASRAGAPVHGLNVPTSLIKKTREMGLTTAADLDRLDPADRAHLPERIIPPPEEQAAMLEEVLGDHPPARGEGNLTQQERRDRFMLVQSIWDTKMAEEAAILHERYGRPVLVLAGENHVRSGYGIKHRLETLDPEGRVLLVAGMRDAADLDASVADVFFYCPPQHKSRMGMVLQERDGEVLVAEVTPESRAAKAGLRPGDVVVEAQGLEVSRLMDLHRAGTVAYHEQAPLVFIIRRSGQVYGVNLGELGKGRKK